MANVTITLTVDTAPILNNPLNHNMGTYCRLSQAGGEDIGNYMVVDLLDTENTVSQVSVNDLITWRAVPSNPGDGASIGGVTMIDIHEINKAQLTGGSLLGDPLPGEWHFGKTIIREVIHEAHTVSEEGYQISYKIISNGQPYGPFTLDPKIRIRPTL